MEPAPPRSVFELSRRAYGAMAASIAPSPSGRVPCFRLWHYPASGSQRSWTVFTPAPGREHGPLVRKIVWDRDADLERLSSSGRLRPSEDPRLETADMDADPVALAALMRDAAWITLPAIQLGPRRFREERTEFGLEGFDRERLDGSRTVVQLAWDRNPPLQLEAVDIWTGRVRDWLLRLSP